MDKKEVLHCSNEHLLRITEELKSAGFGLKDVRGRAQRSVLLKALQYLGKRGLNTYAGNAAGYARLAPRIQDLEAEGWVINSVREDIIGPEGLFHPNVARYILVAKNQAQLKFSYDQCDEFS